MLQSLRHGWDDPSVPQQLLLYRRMVLDKTERLDQRLTLAPSALPIGGIVCSALSGDGTLWFADPQGGLLRKGNLFTGAVEDVSALTGAAPVQALYTSAGTLWAACGECVYSFSVPAVRTAAMRTAARQKDPNYYPAGSDIPEEIAERLAASREFQPDALLTAIGGVSAVCSDETGRYVALAGGVMHFAAEVAYDRRRVELYAGGRYLFGADNSVCGVASDGEGGLWIENAMGYVHIRRFRRRLREKADWYDRLTWELHSARGSLCDINYIAPEDCGNDRLTPDRRYSTNNDALWSVLTAIGDAQRYSVLCAEGDITGARDAKAKFMRVLENVLLQSHVHRFGNGFVCRGYVSARDRFFVKDGHIDTSGFWLKSGEHDAEGNAFCRVEDTALARFGRDDASGKNFLLTDEVKARLGTDADRPVTDSFRMTVPQPAEVPERLARLYREADPYHPRDYPASTDDDIIFKTDTSSEEVIAAFVLYYFAWKHFLRNASSPDDRELLALVRETADAVLTHLLENNFSLRDVHGNPTQWGKWFADYFVDWDGKDKPWRHPSYAYLDGPLNGAEWMCTVRVCMALFDDAPGYEESYRRARAEYERCYATFDGVTNGAGYASLLGEYRSRLSKRCAELTGDGNYVVGINYSDEELAILAFWPLIELETDDSRRQILEAGLDEWWDNMRREDNPFYIYPYAALRGAEGVDLCAAVDYLNRLPLALRSFPVKNSVRNDIVMIPAAFDDEQDQANRVIPVDERRMHKANSSPFTADAGGEPSAALYDRGYLLCGSIFTMPYWTARYYNLLDDTGRR